ncbi:alpha/beta fold hydrolase [Xanthomonas sp. NCPPB 1067]|uniref:alpha/beta fold hydrolase n=1 Tax=Xanthomonas sp. NCPPB 1067 TaxID=487524 RepID=UPI001E553E76|nr:alpha/beta fold hydrolase [Xanthomonas sp. NCPPB 1067]MCC4585707.1 alpha/beta fold hydrolase [Xanthomonas sp. NCPPB 1067]
MHTATQTSYTPFGAPPIHDRRSFLRVCWIATASALGACVLPAADASDAHSPRFEGARMSHDPAYQISYRTQQVGDVQVFYREAGHKDAPVLLLLHGFPSASHMFRDLMPLLARQYRLIAPDLPGFGNTQAPPRGQFAYTFDNLYKVIEGFTEALGLSRYALYVFDYGAPVGLRLAAANPHKVTAIISQNGNAYLEGFSDQWDAWQAYWREPSAANREACRASLSPQTIRDWQYGTGADPSRLSPDGYTLDIAYMARPDAEEIQLDLILDYRSNPQAYPVFQAYFRAHQPPLLAVWGRHDPAFVPAGAQAYRKDLPHAEVHLLDTGHFALETHATEIAQIIGEFLPRALKGAG